MCDKSVDNTNDHSIDINGKDIDDEEEEDTEEEEEVTDGDEEEESDDSDDEPLTADEDNDGSDASADEEEDEDSVTNGGLSVADTGGQSPGDGSPTCYICLNLFSGQDIGSPDSCPDLHYFCLDCIEEWSKQINTCPVDRKRFTYIVVRREIGSTVIMKLPIVQNIVPDIESVPEDVTYCEICGRCDREDRLLLCDGCDFGYHCECLSPPLETIPIEEWFCPDCYQRLFGPETSSSLSVPALRRRAIARTGASEAVRQRILQRRTQRKTTKRKTRRKTTKRKRKSTKRKTSAKTTTGKGGRRKRRTKRRRKRRTKKSALSSRRLPAPVDPRTRIASKLGMGPAPKSPYGLPSMKNMAYESIRKITDLRAAAGISHLSMFGSELDVYDPRVQANDDDNDLMLDSVGVLARTRLPARLHSSPVKQKSHLIDSNSRLNGQLFASSSSTDLLSDIMSAQTLLHSSARDMRIARDGSLRLQRNSSVSLLVRSCPGSGQSSPSRSPSATASPTHSASGSPQRTDNSTTNANNSYNYSFGSASSNRGNSSVNSNYGVDEDIGAIKPLPATIALVANEDSKLELYSDIESIGDNNDNNREDSALSDGGEDPDNKQLVIDDHKSEDNNALDSQTSGQQMDTNTVDNTAKSETTDSDTNRTNDLSRSCDKIPVNCDSKQKALKKQSIYGQSKRRPSIKDLFGDSDDDDEDDTEIRRLLEAQGSINVHYPMKIPIVLKNSMNRKETISDKSDSTLQSSATIDSAPAADPTKWICVTPADTASAIETITTTSGANKWKSIESNDNNVVLSEPKTDSEANKWKPLEETPVCESTCAQDVSAEDIEPKALSSVAPTDVSASECDILTQTEDKQEISCENADHLTACADEEEGEIKDDDQKVRRCRHGRIRRERPKDVSKEVSKHSRHRSRSSESKSRDKHRDKDGLRHEEGVESGNKDIDSDISSNDNQLNEERNVEFKEKTIESLNPEVIDTESEDRIGWKKLSNTSKMRSYRDGKPKDSELLFREREVTKKLVKKSISAKIKAKVGERQTTAAHEHRLKDHNSRRLADISATDDPKHGRKHRTEADKSDESRRHKRKADDPLSATASKRLKRRDDSARSGSSARRSGDEYEKDRHKGRHHKSGRHKRSGEQKDGTERLSGVDSQRRHSHRSSKHLHHKSKCTTGADEVLGHLKGSGGPTKLLRDHTSYADITPLDSKEIYAEGDRIVINVNFKRENSKKLLDNTSTEESNGYNKPLTDGPTQDQMDTRSKPSMADSLKRNANKRDDSIYWASPPPSPQPSSSTSAQCSAGQTAPPSTPQSPLISAKPLTTCITRVEEELESIGGSRSQMSGADRKLMSEKSELLSKADQKSGDDLRFLPRSLHQSDVQTLKLVSEPSLPTFGPHTPEGDYCEDQFMPTPTQDESQSPLRSPSMSSSSRSSPLSGLSANDLSLSAKDDVYDPEAPLQSPPDHQSSTQSPHKKASGRRVESKSPEISSRRESSKRSPNRRPTASAAEHKSRYESKDIPKSSPALSTTSSTTHSSIHSPFKSPSVLPQRQQIKSSPQKPVLSSQQKSSSALMPPPMAPTSRPQSLAAAFASINPQNLAQLLQMAQTLSTKQNNAKQHRQSSGHQIRHGTTATNNSINSSLNNNQNNNRDHNRDHNEVVDMDVESPSPPQQSGQSQQPRVSSTTGAAGANTSASQVKTLWDQIIKSTQQTKPVLQKRTTSAGGGGRDSKKPYRASDVPAPNTSTTQKDRHHPHRHQVISVADNKKQLTNSGSKLDQLTVLDDVPSSAVEMAVKEKFIKKLNRQERVIEEVKLVLKPHYQKRTVSKEEYKEILRKSVPKICHSRSGEINPVKIKSLVEGYIKRYKHLRKKTKKVTKK